MYTQKYTREQLRALPIEARKRLLKSTITPFIQQIVGAATTGQTSIMLNPPDEHRGIQRQPYNHNGQSAPTVDEICEALREEFPDCTISYQEKWVEVTQAKKELKKGIEVDWS
jgi:hypothetical protein